MSFDRRSEREVLLTVDGTEYTAVMREIPFREGVELSCSIDGEQVRVSDRGLGEHEALRLLEEEIRRFLQQGYTNEI